MHTPYRLPYRLWNWRSDKEYAVVWHIVNAENGFPFCTPQYLALLVANLANTPATHPFWEEVTKPACAVTGFNLENKLITLNHDVPHDESPIAGVAVWFRSTGSLSSDFLEAEREKLLYNNLFCLYKEIGDLLEYDVCGVLFPPTLDEINALIKLGESILYKEAVNSVDWPSFTPKKLAAGWDRMAGPPEKRYKVFECFMLYVHPIKRHGAYKPMPIPKNQLIKRIERNPAPGIDLTRFANHDELEYYPRFTQVQDACEQKRMLPHRIRRVKHPLPVGSDDDLPGHQYENLGEEEPKMVLPFDPTRHLMMVFKFLRRLKEAGWIFTDNLRMIYEAVEWYLVLAESVQPFHMWYCRDQRPVHLDFQLPMMPPRNVGEEVYRPDLFDRQLHNRTMLVNYDKRYELRQEDNPPVGDDADYGPEHGGRAHQNTASGSYGGGRPHTAASGSNADLNHASQVPNESVEHQQQSPTNTIDNSVDSVEAAAQHDEFIESSSVREIICTHYECTRLLRDINEALCDLFDQEARYYEDIKTQYGHATALKEMRYRDIEEWKLIHIKTLQREKARVMSLLHYCDGNCSLQAVVQGLTTSAMSPVERMQVAEKLRAALRSNLPCYPWTIAGGQDMSSTDHIMEYVD